MRPLMYNANEMTKPLKEAYLKKIKKTYQRRKETPKET